MAQRLSRQAHNPPPVPGQGSPLATSSEETTSPGGQSPLNNLVSKVPGLLAAVREEVAAVENAGSAEKRMGAANVCVRLALLESCLADFDVSEGKASELVHESVRQHPLWATLALNGCFVTTRAADFVERAESLVDKIPDGASERHEVLLILAEALLFAFADPKRAASISGQALSDAPEEHLHKLVELHADALWVMGDWTGFVDVAAQASPETRLQAAVVCIDALDDVARAHEFLDPLTKVRLSERAARMRDFLLLETALLGGENTSSEVPESLVTLVGHFDANSAIAKALGLLRRILSVPADSASLSVLTELSPLTKDVSWNAPLVFFVALRHALAQENKSSVADCLDALARASSGSAQDLFVRRLGAMRILRADCGDFDETLLAGKDGHDARRSLLRHALSGDPASLVQFFKTSAEQESDPRWARRAAWVAECRLGDFSTALDLCDHPGRRLGLLAKLGSGSRMSTALRDMTEGRDVRSRAALLCVAGVVDWVYGNFKQAASQLEEAIALEPKDSVAALMLARVYQQEENSAAYLAALAKAVQLVASKSQKLAGYRELGHVYLAAGDHAAADAVLRAAVELDDRDTESILAMAQLAEKGDDYERAAALLKKAARLVEPERASQLWVSCGELEEVKLDRPREAIASYEQASALHPDFLPALRARVRVHGALGEHRPMADVLRSEIEVSGDPARKVELYVSLATAEQKLGEIDAALGALGAALRFDANNESVLKKIRKIAQEHERWETLVEALSLAEETLPNLEALAQAYSELQKWPQLTQILTKQEELASSKERKVLLASKIGKVLEEKLDDRKGAISTYQRVIVMEPKNLNAQAALTRLLADEGQWGELCEVIQEQIRSSGDVARRKALWSRLAEIRGKHLNDPEQAALALEEILKLEPGSQKAFRGLDEIYTELGRDSELLRLLQARAAAEPTVRGIAVRIATIKAQHGDIEGANAAFGAAYLENRDDRGLFTEWEKICYHHERWDFAVALYSRVIVDVEAGVASAYRLNDLYSRLGQVQLQYVGDVDAALISFEKVLELKPGDVEALGALETIYAYKSDWQGLIDTHMRTAREVASRTDQLAALQKALEITERKLKDSGSVVKILQRILEVEPGNADALKRLEKQFQAAGRWADLAAFFETQLEAVGTADLPAAMRLREKLAWVHEEHLRDGSKAIDYYRAVVAEDPSHKDALDALARIFESTERWGEFVDITRKQVKITDDKNIKALLYFKCGSVMEAKFGKEEEAMRYYDAAIKTSPGCLPAVHGLRDLLLRRQDWPRVIRTLELEVKLWQDEKERAGVYAQMGRIHAEKLGQPERALHYYESAIAVDPDCGGANKALFDHYFDRQEWTKAVPLAHAILRRGMRDGSADVRSEFYRRSGLALRWTGDPTRAAESMISALELSPTNMMALENLLELSQTHPLVNDFPATFRNLEKVYRKRSDSGALLARVLVAQADQRISQGDLDAAEELFAEALAGCPNDSAIVYGLVGLRVGMRRWSQAVAAIEGYLHVSKASKKEHVEALLRIADIYSEGEMNPQKAIQALDRALECAEDTLSAEIHYRRAQELFVLGRYDQAQEAIDKVIEIAAAPGQDISAKTLARYYYYLGRILEASGDSRGAAPHYRRAAEYDPAYGPPALALARRAVAGNDYRGAETTLISAARAAMVEGDEHAAVPLQRGLAQVLLKSGDRASAIEAYRGILAVEPGSAVDRISLAEAYAESDLFRALVEAKKVLADDVRLAPAYRLLADFFSQSGEEPRALRVLTAMDLMGFSQPEDLDRAQEFEKSRSTKPMSSSLSADLRASFLVTEALASPLGDFFYHAAKELSILFSQPYLGEDLTPAQTCGDAALMKQTDAIGKLFNVEPEVFVGRNVPRGVVALTQPRPVVVVDRWLLAENEAARRCVLGYSFEAVRGGYAFLLSLGQGERTELAALLKSVFLPVNERPYSTTEYIEELPATAQKIVEEHGGSFQDLDFDDWIDGVIASARRAALFACDDLRVTAKVMGKMAGETVEGPGLGTLLCGENLIRFYMGDSYHRLQESVRP